MGESDQSQTALDIAREMADEAARLVKVIETATAPEDFNGAMIGAHGVAVQAERLAVRIEGLRQAKYGS